MTHPSGDTDHRCRSWHLGKVVGPIADGVGDFWRCHGIAVRLSAPEAAESCLTVYRALLARHLSTAHRLSPADAGSRLALTRTETARLLALASAPLPDGLIGVSRGGIHERALAILGTILPFPMATPAGEQLLAAVGGTTPDRLYPDIDAVADAIGSHPDHFRPLGRPAHMRGALFRLTGRDVTTPLTLADTGSRPLRRLDTLGLVGGIDGTRLPIQRVRYEPRRKQWQPLISWVHVVVGVAGRPSVIVALRVGRERHAVVQDVVHDMAAAGLGSPFVLCHDGLATYKADPFLLACLTYGFEPHEVNFPWENPAEAAINQLKARWPEPCPKDHFGAAAADALQEILDPVRGSSFVPTQGRVGFSEATLFLANFRSLQPARVEGGAAYHDGVLIPVRGVPDGTPVLTGLRFDQTELVGLDQYVEAHALAISLDGPSGSPQDWALSMGITGVRSLGSTPLLREHGRMGRLSEPTHPGQLPLPDLAPASLAARLDLELARSDARRPHRTPGSSDPSSGPSDDPQAVKLAKEVAERSGVTPDRDPLEEPGVLPGTLFPDPGKATREGSLAPEVTRPALSEACVEWMPGADRRPARRREVHAARSGPSPDARLQRLIALSEELAQAPFVPALPRWFDHPELQRAATTKGLVAGARSLGVVMTGHDAGTLGSHTIISSATFQQLACQPLPGAPGPQVDPTGRPTLGALVVAVDSAIRQLSGPAAIRLRPSESSRVGDWFGASLPSRPSSNRT